MTGTFAYPGSKTTYASWIIGHFPEHTQYIEAFGGAGSVLVAKKRSDLEVYNDINTDCVTFFECVRDHPDELARWVRNTPSSRELFSRYIDEYPEWPDDPVEYAGRFLYVQQHCFGGKLIGIEESPTYGVITANSYRGSDLDAYENKWVVKEDHIFKLRDRFKGVNIENLDYNELIKKYDTEDVFYYFDPPYVDVGDGYYQTECGGFDHERFIDTLLGLDGNWLVSYDHNIPERLADYHTVRRTKNASINLDHVEKVETLTMNYDPETTVLFRENEQAGLGEYQ